MRKLIFIFLGLLILSFTNNSSSDPAKPKLIKFTENYKIGYKDQSGRVVVPNIYDAGSEFEDGMAIILVGPKRGYLSEDGKIAIEPQFQDASLFHFGLAAVKKDGKYGYINRDGKFIIPNTLQNAFDFIEGVARVQINEKWGLINPQGKIVFPANYEEIYDCSQGLILVKDHKTKLYGYINPETKWVIEPKFTVATPFTNEKKAMIKQGEIFYFINMKGEITGEVPKHKEEEEREEKR